MWPAANDIDYALLEPSPLFEDCVEDVGKMTAGTLQASCRDGMVMQPGRFPKVCGLYLAKR